MYATARICYCNSNYLSLSPSHGLISQKRSKLEAQNLYCGLPQEL